MHLSPRSTIALVATCVLSFTACSDADGGDTITTEPGATPITTEPGATPTEDSAVPSTADTAIATTESSEPAPSTADTEVPVVDEPMSDDDDVDVDADDDVDVDADEADDDVATSVVVRSFDETDPSSTALRDHFDAIGLDVPDDETQCISDTIPDATVTELIAANWGTQSFRPIDDMLPVLGAQDTCWSRDTQVAYLSAINAESPQVVDIECLVDGIIANGGNARVFGSGDQFTVIIDRCSVGG